MRTIFLSALLATAVQADIVINEISATTYERTLRWDDNDQPFVGSGPAWWSSSFDDSTWQTGSLPVGYSSGTINTDLSAQLNNVSPSFYVRKTFSVTPGQAVSTLNLLLNIQYNDGFIVWLNGKEVARENMGAPKNHVYADQLSYRASTNSTTTRTISLGTAGDLLVDDQNVIAIQVNNNTLNASMRLDVGLELETSSELFGFGTPVSYLPGLREPSSDLVEPALLTAPGNDTDPSDWIELHNNGTSTVDLTGWTLTDSMSNASKWTFPSGSSIPAGGHLVVLADDPDDPIAGATYLHTNFKLSSGGEFLGLYDASATLTSSIDPSYPKQYPNHSYGRNSAGNLVFFAVPSPGSTNTGDTFTDRADAPDFDNLGGFYDDPVTLTLTSETPSATIRYTTDGTEPTLTNGLTYSTPLALSQISTKKGHVIRARSFATGLIPSSIKTHTFLIGQDARLRNSPSLIYAGDPQRSLYDPFGALALNGGTYSGGNWSPTSPTDYNNIVNRGRAYERPIHAEFYFPDGTVGFRSDVGLRVAASSWSRPRMVLNSLTASPWTSNSTQKPSFNLYFRDEYGNPTVNLPLNGPGRSVSDYERFRIRAGKNDIRNPFIIDELFRRLSDRMGNPASMGVINSLYVNGELKGYYNMVERVREPFLQRLQSSDPDAQWDILAYENGTDNVAEGDKDSWNDMITRVQAATTTSNWESVLEVADVESIADYYLLNIYGATWDWPHNNWIAAKERSTEGRFRLYVWDAEGAMNNAGNRPVSQEMINTHIATGDGELRDLWRGLNRWDEFKIVIADRIHKHFFNDGILDDRDWANSRVKSEFDHLVTEFSDLLRVVNNQAVTTSRTNLWGSPTSGRRTYLFGPRREDFRDRDLWPEIAPPTFSQFGGSMPQGNTLKITNEEGIVYYTTDGSDPRLLGGNPNPTATSQAGSLLEGNLISSEDTWNYNSTDGDQGGFWRIPLFDPSVWPSGTAPFGYGNINNNGMNVVMGTTINNFIPRQPTCYFRKDFEIENADSFVSLTLKLQVDAGAIVYINGFKAFHEANIPDPATYDTIPTDDDSDGDEGNFGEYPIDPNLLVEGTNIIAVEVHNSPTSSDMVFDLALDGTFTNPDNFPLPINGPTTIKARSFDNGVWSALTEAAFTVETVPAATANLAFAEILYNPVGPSPTEEAAGYDDGDLFEFIRLDNIGDTTVDLQNVRFTSGVEFDLSDTQVLYVGASILLVKDLDAFRFRYGNTYDSIIAGEYGGKLNNSGNLIRLVGQDDTIIQEFEYGTTSPWPDLSLLDGHSIQIIDPAGDHNDGSNWMASANLGGNPDGSVNFDTWMASFFTPAQLADPTITGPNADPDGDGWTNIFEFGLGSQPQNETSTPAPLTGSVEMIGADRYLVLSYTRTPGSRISQFSAEISDELETWAAGGIPHSPDIIHPDGSTTSRFRHPDPVTSDLKQFMRLKVTE